VIYVTVDNLVTAYLYCVKLIQDKL
jgi:hypothetical protein